MPKLFNMSTLAFLFYLLTFFFPILGLRSSSVSLDE